MGEHKYVLAGLRGYRHPKAPKHFDRSGVDPVCKDHKHVDHPSGWPNRDDTRHPNKGLNKHGRVMVFGEVKDPHASRVEFQLTKTRPWVRRSISRRKNKQSKLSRRRNRGK